MPLERVAASALAVGDLVRLADTQAHRVERVLMADGRVVLDLRPVGLVVDDSVRAVLPAGAVVDRLGSVGE